MGSRSERLDRKDEAHAIKKSKSSSKKRKAPEPELPEAEPKVASEPTGWEEVEAVDVPVAANTDIGVDSTNDTKGDHTKKPSTKEKNARKRLRAGSKADHERAIRDAERRRFEGDAAPTSAVEFEQLVLASPNSSYVWIKYIAFLISMGDIDGARKVAEKAISTIHYREESEKLNIWVAWLNAENLYGTEETTAQVLGKALTHADGRKLYLAAVDIFDRTDKTALAEQCLKAMCRKYGAAPDVWIRAIRYRLAHADSDAARRTLDRAMQSLPKHEHVGVASQAALLEFKLGDPERGRSMFEGILANYPRRLDLWSVYLDQEILQGDQQRIRALFERATHLALPPKKMKFLFKRYLEYERAHGDDSSVEHVKHKAMEFVERAMGQ